MCKVLELESNYHGLKHEQRNSITANKYLPAPLNTWSRSLPSINFRLPSEHRTQRVIHPSGKQTNL